MFGRDFGDESAGNAAHPLAVDTAVGVVARLVMRYPVPRWNVLRVHIWRGIVVTFMALSFFAALARLPLAAAIALSFIAPLIALYLAALLLKEKIGGGSIVASILGLLGVAVILLGRKQGGVRKGGVKGKGVSVSLDPGGLR